MIILLIGCAAIFPIKPWAAEPKSLTLDFDDSDPVEYQARIMEIDYEKAQLVVAEDPILIVDLMVAGERLATRVTDANGKPKPLAFFKAGDMVFIQGFKNADGVVFAAVIQKIILKKGKIKYVPKTRQKRKKRH
jgi:hypothetical protein